jgi:AcrR family transcriptional regulator
MVVRATPEKKEEKERVRLALLGAALRLSAAHGFASLGLREVSREAGIAPTSFYRHFADMGELGRALIEERVAELVARLVQCVAPDGDSDATTGALTSAMLTAVDDEPELLRFLLSERVGSFASLRNALRDELAKLSLTLCKASKARVEAREQDDEGLSPFAADAAVTLLLDGAARALDQAPAQRTALSEALAAAMARLIEPHSGARRRP